MCIPSTIDYSVNSSLTTLDVHLSPDHASSSWRKPSSEPAATSVSLLPGAAGNCGQAYLEAHSVEEHAVSNKVSTAYVSAVLQDE